MREITPKPRAGEIRHAGGAVVDDGQAAGAQRESRARRQDRCGSRRTRRRARLRRIGVEPGAARRIVERVVREAPAGERGRVAVHDADAQSADLRHQVHRQRGRVVPSRRQGRRGPAQLGQDLVRARAPRPRRPTPDRRSRSRRRCRLGRAISVSTLPRIADGARRARRSRRTSRGSASNQWKSPLNTMRTRRARARQPLDRVERREIAVEAADDVEHVCGRSRARGRTTDGG